MLGGEFLVPPLLYETLHAYLPGIPLFVTAFMRGEIHLDMSKHNHISTLNSVLQLETVAVSVELHPLVNLTHASCGTYVGGEPPGHLKERCPNKEHNPHHCCRYVDS